MRMTLKRMRQQALAMVLLLSLAACGKWEEKPVSAADLLEKKMRMAIHEEERERLEKLREESSVRSATIVTGLNKIGAGTEYEYLVARNSFSISIRSHSRGIDGAIRSPVKSGRMPRIPSTHPTITVDAVPVSQCTCERPKCRLSFPSVNCP